MHSLSPLITAGLLGVLLGSAFFYCLWFSANKVLNSRHPVSWFISAWLGRMLFALGGFFLVSRGNWQLLLACLIGFIAGRWLVRKLIVDKTTTPQIQTASSSGIALAAKSASGAKHAP